MKQNQFISIVTVVKNPDSIIKNQLVLLVDFLKERFRDFDIVIIDNGSGYDNRNSFKKFCQTNNHLKNIQVSVLNNQVDLDIATCAGIDLALGDLICVLDLIKDNFLMIDKMMQEYVKGSDVVLGSSNLLIKRSWYTLILRHIFLYVYKVLNGFSIEKEASRFRLISRRIVNYIFQYSKPEDIYRRVPVMGGFKRAYVIEEDSSKSTLTRSLRVEIMDNLSLIFSLNKNLLRLANFVCLIAAIFNVLYSIYVVVSLFVRDNIAEGWASLSLQQSGMFFLISIVLLLLSEFLLNNSDSSSSPKYFISEEFSTNKHHLFQEKNITK